MSDNQCFIDTGAFIALNSPNDQYFNEAREIAKSLNGYRFIISDAVITETYTILRYRLGFHTAHRFLRTVLESNEYDIFEVSPSVRKVTMELLEKYNDQKISYCDALSVAIMKQLEIDVIFAFDHHFELMGTRRLYSP
jgi:predicted nucleic acid-binding protein